MLISSATIECLRSFLFREALLGRSKSRTAAERTLDTTARMPAPNGGALCSSSSGRRRLHHLQYTLAELLTAPAGAMVLLILGGREPKANITYRIYPDQDTHNYALCGRFSLNQAFLASYLPM